MSVTSTSQLSLRSPSSRENEGSTFFASILLKKEKTLEDAQAIYEKIKGFSFFHDFCAANLNKLDMPKLLNLCQGFKYETIKREDFVYRQGDPSNEKFYIILSGEVAIVNTQRLGDFGETQPVSLLIKTPTNQTFLTAKDYTTVTSAKKSIVLSARDSDRKVISLNEIPIERKKVIKRLEGIANREETDENSATQPQSATEVGKSKTSNKLRAVYDAVKALRTMQKCLPVAKKTVESLNDIERRGSTAIGTLQYLDEEENQEQSRKEFEELASNYGNIVQYLGVGESFGEQALKRNVPRQSSILCGANCEFLTLEKQQFDEVFGKIEKEKEEFLKSVFPLLMNISSANYNFLVCCFKAERYSKGSYIINEGSVNKQKAKFYVIQAGECLLEKKILRELSNPYNLKRTLVSSYDNVQITVAGRGSVVGEEIIRTDGEYEYSVKAISDTVLVQAITKKEFKLRFPQDFQEYVASLYETKKKHREEIYNNIKKDNQTKINQYKADNVYCMANASIANLTTKAAKHCFSRQMQRESKLTEVPINNFFSSTTSPRNQAPSYRETSLASVRSTFNCDSMKETSPKSFRCTGFNSDSKMAHSDKKNKQDFVSQKIEFLSRIQSPVKQPQNEEDNILETAKVLAEIQDDRDRKTIKIRLQQMAKQNNRTDRKPNHDKKSDRTPRDLILNRLLNKKEEIEYIQGKMASPEPLDVPKIICLTPKSIPSTRSSFKFGALTEINSFHNQKLQKGRITLNPTSPSSTKISDFENKIESLNEISTSDCVVLNKPPEIKFPRNGSIGSWSFKALKIFPETEKAASSKNIKEGLEIAGRASTKHINRQPVVENERDARRFTSFFDTEKMSLQERSSMLNEMDNKRGSVVGKGTGKDEILKEKGAYAQLNEAKEFRKKVFKRPQRQGSTAAAKADVENMAVEGS